MGEFLVVRRRQVNQSNKNSLVGKCVLYVYKHDGIMADLRWKKRMPVRDDLRLVTLEYSDSEKLLDAERDILALVKGLNRLFNLSGAIPPFVVATAVEGEFLINFFIIFLKKL